MLEARIDVNVYGKRRAIDGDLTKLTALWSVTICRAIILRLTLALLDTQDVTLGSARARRHQIVLS